MSDENSAESALTPDLAEAVFIAIAVLGVVLAAILIPGPYPIETGGGGGGLGEGTGSSSIAATPASGTQGAQREASIENSSPTGIGFSDPPPETQVGQPIREPLALIPLFVATADEQRYWRQTSYGDYTGTSWEQAHEWVPLNGSVPNDRLTGDGEAVSYDIELLVSTSSLPTVWQPEAVSDLSADTAIQVADDGGIRSASPLDSGATFSGRSARPAATAEQLEAAGTDYPPAIERRYTGLPAETPAQVGKLTDSVTAEADSPYEKAVQIRDWLGETKEYTLDASHEPGEPVVDQFLFEMDAGYCQYFASAMAVMLRTQGVPTRYVTGYAGGTDIGQNRTLVTSVSAHAWVEVYFPGHGWVRFDPTPAGRLAVRNPQPPYDISLNRSAVAGADVTVSVEKNGTPVIGSPVFVDGQRVGWTDVRGNVSTRLPYEESFTVTARPPSATGQPGPSGPDDGSQSIGGAPPRSLGDDGRRYALVPPALGSRSQADDHTPNQTTATYRSDSNVSLRVTGTRRVGGTVTIGAEIADVPMRNGTVRLDGELVGETNGTGQLAVSLAGIEPGTHRVRVRRGPFTAAVQLEVSPRRPPEEETATPSSEPTAESLALSISRPLGWALPGTPVTVAVERADQPVSNATVGLDGESVGTTDVDGTLWVWLPPQDSVALTATGPTGATGTQELSGLFTNLAMLLVSVSVLVGAGLLARRRFDRPAGRLLAWLSRRLRALKRRLLNAVVDGVDRLIAGHTSFRSWVRSLRPRVAAALAKLRRRGLDDWPSLDPHRLSARLRRWLVGIGAALRELFQRDRPSEPRAATDGQRTDEPRQPSLEELWARFVRALPLSYVATRTPGEVARYAVSQGFPEGPVRSLTEAYREAEYGHREPEESRLKRLREDAGSLRDPRRHAEEEGPEPP